MGKTRKFKRGDQDIEILIGVKTKIFLRPRRPLTYTFLRELRDMLRETRNSNTHVVLPADFDVIVISEDGTVTKY